MRSYGYDDKLIVSQKKKKALPILLGLIFLTGVWLALDIKLLLGQDWLSPTYDNSAWRTNEGSLQTYGAWDLEAHIWKTEYIRDNFPHFLWNPYWYLGMPLLEYYQPTFYFINWAVSAIFAISAARAALLIIIFGHLLAAMLTFYVCYNVSKNAFVSALSSSFLLSNNFMSLRSYGWEPITVAFLFFYPLGLHYFLKEPLKPFRFSLMLILGLTYISHPLIFFALCMTIGLYLLYIAFLASSGEDSGNIRYIGAFLVLVVCSLIFGGIQFFSQIEYTQVTSGAHMGVKYLPFYQVPFNIISPQDFFFAPGDLKGPGPIVMISFLLIGVFCLMDVRRKKSIFANELTGAFALVLLTMVMLYYFERYNIFPMNFFRSIQYHRIIPEFIIAASILVASISNLLESSLKKAIYYPLLISFALVSGIIIFQVQGHWETSSQITDRPEFINSTFEGRISFPYPDQSLSVRSSFGPLMQTYGYYEQGITNPYDDEIFSVSSGFHKFDLTLLYLKAANVQRLYVNTEEGERDRKMMGIMNRSFELKRENERYSYFEIPLLDPRLAEAVSYSRSLEVEKLAPSCRMMFQERYCGSVGEEFVSTDLTEQKYLSAYVRLLEEEYVPSVKTEIVNPDSYKIKVMDATKDTSVVVKMTYDKNFKAYVDGNKVKISAFGPYFMLIYPAKAGSYEISLKYYPSMPKLLGAASFLGMMVFAPVYFLRKRQRRITVKKGDMH